MSQDINHLIKPVMKNGEVVNHKVSDCRRRVLEFQCSTYIEKENILVKGEYNNICSRNALLVFFDLRTGTVKGESNLFVSGRVTKGFPKTSNKQSVFSVGHFEFENQTYVLGSCKGAVELFGLRHIKDRRLIGKCTC